MMEYQNESNTSYRYEESKYYFNCCLDLISKHLDILKDNALAMYGYCKPYIKFNINENT